MPTWKRTRAAATTAAPAGPAEQIPGYSDLHRIGHGGFSVVYRAHHAGLARVVALKVLTVEFIDAQIKRGLLREVQLAGRLSGHPNVVTVLDSGLTSSGRPFIAMDYYERGSLRDRLAAEGPLPLAEVLRVGIKIAGALAAAHQEGILHRDVKPQNILISRYNEPALADFGTARLTAELEASARTEALTPFHAAPEVLEGHPPAPAADVYSLGSTLYQLLAGRPAFQRDADFGIAPLLLRILTEEVPPISRPDVPEQISAVIRQAMHRDPAQRFVTAQALLDALRQQQHALGLQLTETAGPRNGPQAQPPNGSQDDPQAESRQGHQPPAPDLAPPGLALPPINATPWDYAEKTGYRPPAAAPPAGPGPAVAPPPAWPDDTATVPHCPPDSPEGLPSGAAPQARGGWGPPDHEPAPGDSGAPSLAVPPAAPRRGRWRVLTVGGLCVVAALAVAIPLLLTGHSAKRLTPPPSPAPTLTTGPSRPPTQSAGPPPGAAPTGLTVRLLGSRTAGILTWHLQPGNKFPLIVDQVQPAAGSPVPLAFGTTSYTVTGLSAGVVYCFRVGAVTALGSQAGQTQFAWSSTACTG